MHAADQEISHKWLSIETEYQWIYFQLEAEVGARLILTDNYQSTKNAYYFYIGDQQGTQCTLYRGEWGGREVVLLLVLMMGVH